MIRLGLHYFGRSQSSCLQITVINAWRTAVGFLAPSEVNTPGAIRSEADATSIRPAGRNSPRLIPVLAIESRVIPASIRTFESEMKLKGGTTRYQTDRGVPRKKLNVNEGFHYI